MHYSKEEKAMWLEDWKASGKKAWAYAKENGLIPQTFVGWVKKGTEAKSGFVEIQPQASVQLQVSMILVEKGDMKIHIPAALSGDKLRAVIEGLGAVL